jgi:hypothetical protein
MEVKRKDEINSHTQNWAEENVDGVYEVGTGMNAYTVW